MRVITGTARGTILKAPDGMATRPTADKVKQALFNIIQFETVGEVLDLFAGSGIVSNSFKSNGFCGFASGCSCSDKREFAQNALGGSG